MKRVPLRALIAAGALGLLALFVAACGSSDKAPAGSKELSFTLTNEGCSPHDATASAGPINFKVKGESAGVTELEVLDGETLLGERENITDGLSGSFALTLEEGEYTVRCNGGSEEDGTLKVTGNLETATSPAIEKAITDYKKYLLENSEELTAKTKPFVEAVENGEIEKAKQIYPEPRINYERIEPVAESFGNLDPEIDARANDVSPSEFKGFHRIEKALWEEETTKGMTPVAQGLLKNVEELESKIKGNIKIQATEIANGANELLTEVSTSKITGEEERYSHIDLVDFKANVEGSQVAFEAVKPLIEKSQPALVKGVASDYEAVYAALKPYERKAYPGFVYYGELTKADTRKLAQVIDALAEKSAQIPAQIAKGEVE
jgi:iron uptake system component EfeO